MIKLTIPGRPISKSNFKLTNIHGQAWMPAKGKHSKYLAYENMIAGYINQQYQGEQIEEDLITVLKLYFPNKRMGDLHNYPKSICDGIEKSGIIKNAISLFISNFGYKTFTSSEAQNISS